LVIEYGAKCGGWTLDDFNNGLYCACFASDHEEKHEIQRQLAMIMIAHGANDFNSGFRAACWSGDQQLVKLMMDHGADDFDGGIKSLKFKEDNEILQMILEKKLKLKEIL
jgi:hypothetical protein